MMTPAPNASQLAVVAARLDDVVTRLDKLAESLEQGFVRKDVYQADRQADAISLKGIEDEQHNINKRIDKAEENATANRRLAIGGLVYPLIVGVIVALIVAAVHH